MEPLHITEFASARYFEKLNQIRNAQSIPGGSSTQQQDVGSSEGSLPQAPFILPLRGAHTIETEEVIGKPSDPKVREKSRFLSFRSRILHSKAQAPSSTEQVDRRPSLAESTKQRFVSCPAFYAMTSDFCDRPRTDLMM